MNLKINKDIKKKNINNLLIFIKINNLKECLKFKNIYLLESI